MNRIKQLAQKQPFIVFALGLLLLFGVIVLSNLSTKSPQEDLVSREEFVRNVHIFDMQEMQYMNALARVDRSDTITLVATAQGIIQRVVQEGSYSSLGQEIAKLSDSYGGSSSADAAIAIARRNAAYQRDVFDKEVKNLKDQKDSLNKTDRAEVKIARRQISLQKRAVELSRDTAQLQLSQSTAVAAPLRTVAPFAGRIEDVYVERGDLVSPGQSVALLRSEEKNDVLLTAYVGKIRAAHIDIDQPIIIESDGSSHNASIRNIAQSPTLNGTYGVTITAPQEVGDILEDGTYIEIQIPMVTDDMITVPIDAVHYGREETSVYILVEGRVEERIVSVGTIIGEMILVQGGISRDDLIILDRVVSVGERVKRK